MFIFFDYMNIVLCWAKYTVLYNFYFSWILQLSCFYIWLICLSPIKNYSYSSALSYPAYPTHLGWRYYLQGQMHPIIYQSQLFPRAGEFPSRSALSLSAMPLHLIFMLYCLFLGFMPCSFWIYYLIRHLQVLLLVLS